MNPSGVLLTVVGVLVVAQVLRGQALERLGIANPFAASTTSSTGAP